MKAEIGMYVRTDKTGIKKIYKIDNNKTKYKYLYKLKSQDGDGCIDLGVLSDNNIKKTSFNIIDLIEVGDYVNGVEVMNIDDEWITMSDIRVPILKSIANGLIETIVTREQFEAMEYKVGENNE